MQGFFCQLNVHARLQLMSHENTFILFPVEILNQFFTCDADSTHVSFHI